MNTELANESKERALWEDFGSERTSAVREEILRFYEPLARSIAARTYAVRFDNSVSFADYLQYARVGLLEAVDRFDPTRGVAFRTFASARIRGAVLNGLAKESEIAAQNRFWRSHIRDRIDSLVTAVAPSADRISLSQIATVTVGLALGVLLEDSKNEFEPADQNPQNNPYAANEVRQLQSALKELLVRLPEREREIIKSHYLESTEFQQLANQMSVTKGRISQLHAQALKRLRAWLDEQPTLDRKV